jgi:hypothetical protein
MIPWEEFLTTVPQNNPVYATGNGRVSNKLILHSEPQVHEEDADREGYII